MRIWLALLVLCACFGQKKTAGGPKELKGSGAGGAVDDLRIPPVDASLCDSRGKKVVTRDLNDDGKPEVWKLYRTVEQKGTKLERLSCKQVDLDGDGRKDYIVEYDESGAMLVEDADHDFDGKFDVRIHYDKKTGKKYLIERVKQFGKGPSVWEKYDANERIESVREDRNFDTRPDYWEQYTAGVLDKILYDDDYDGRVDRQDLRKAEAPPAAPAPAETPAAKPSTPAAKPSAPAAKPPAKPSTPPPAKPAKPVK